MNQPIRILHVFGGMNLGGAESRIMDLYRHIDRGRVQFDFLVHTAQEGYFDKEIKELGGRIYRVPRFRLYNYFAYRKACKKFFEKNHDFKAIQGHMTSTAGIYLPLAKKAGIPITIAHARSAGVDKGAKGIVTRWLRRNLDKKADYLFTCSRLAGISVFGKKAVENNRTVFIPNAINCSAFVYDEGKRQCMRKVLGLEGKYVIGHVGRFHYAKNHEYLIRIFAKLSEKGKKDYRLLLAGEGDGMTDAKKLTKELQIEDKVIFAGNKANVYDYYQAMDYFVYPSRYEGLPGTVVEAQTAGLRCLMSDTICEEVAVTELVTTMSIEENPDVWADFILQTEDYERSSHLEEMQQAGFDVNSQSGVMINFYESGKWLF
ncbi:MAG: glycosyltransferase family 1 protein [Lachnospiraceae bacterium]|nr:glycosyltransferase family 1 protein [Lachnospiraceae bacterium]